MNIDVILFEHIASYKGPVFKKRKALTLFSFEPDFCT